MARNEMKPRTISGPCFILALASIVGLPPVRPQSPGSSVGPTPVQSERPKEESSTEFDRVAKLANEARESERVAEAISLYKEALRIRPSWDEGWWYLGTLYYSVDRHADALDAFRHLFVSRPKHGPTWAFVGLCEFQLKDYERALTDLEEARSLGLGDNRLLVNVTRYNIAILSNRFERFERAYEQLQEFAQENNEDPSVVEALGLSVLRMAYLPVELPPDKYDLVLMAGRASYKMASGRGDDADRLFQELIARYPQTANVHYAYGVFLLPVRPDKAIEEFRRELRISPKHVPASLQIAFEYHRRGDYKAALPFAKQAVELAPNMFNARRALGLVYLDDGEVTLAIRELETGDKLEPESPEIHYALARAYARAGRKGDAARERAEFSRLDKIQRGQREGPQSVGGLKANPGETQPK